MSYYVLSSATNLSNILSTESISPASLYARRSYGFRYYDRLESDVDDSILLYDKLPPRPKGEDDLVAMVMEIDDDVVSSPKKGDDGSLWTSETIRITPDNCKLIFYSEDELNGSFNGVQRSIEAKLASRYRDCARAQEFVGDLQLPIDELSCRSIPPEGQHPEDVARFERLDRIKGAIFGYCLGFCYSLPRDKRERDISQDYVKYLTIVNDLINSVTQEPIEGLDGLRRSLEAILYKFVIGGEMRKLRQNSNEAFEVNDRIRNIERLSTIELPLDIKGDSFKLNGYRSQLEERIRTAKDDWRGHTPLRDEYKPSVLKNTSGPVLQLPARDGGLASHLINRLIRDDVLGSTNRALGYPFALECGKAIRKYLGDKWEDSGERKYVNGLLPHLNVGDKFDPKINPGISDDENFTILKLLAYLCERADNKELDNYYRHLLIRCQVTDFALPFSLWGAAFGFSALPKTLFDSISWPAERCARKLFDEVLGMLNHQDEASS